jgi:hypothetical protein
VSFGRVVGVGEDVGEQSPVAISADAEGYSVQDGRVDGERVVAMGRELCREDLSPFLLCVSAGAEWRRPGRSAPDWSNPEDVAFEGRRV